MLKEMVSKVRLLSKTIDKSGKIYMPGQELEVIVPASEGITEVIVMRASGLRLYASEFEFVVDDREYERLLYG